ncbi:MAG: hypothetical protein ABL986_02995 [Vicinamibacterales bacterium]
MSANPHASEFRVEKARSYATLTLSNSETVLGCFFVSTSSPSLPGPERVGELLNTTPGLFPFEIHSDGPPRTILINREQVFLVELAENEARHDSGYDIAKRRMVAVRLANGQRIVGTVRVYRPEGSDRLSDWARQPDQFRYIELDHVTAIVNVAHVIDASEVPQQ